MLGTFDITNCFYFLTVISTFDTACCVFCDKFITSSTFCTFYTFFTHQKILIVLIPWVKLWHIHFACIIIKLRQSITDWNLHKINKIIWQTTQQYYEFFYPFWFWISSSSNTHNWLANIWWWWWWRWWIAFVVCLTDERRWTLFPAKTIVRGPHHRESPTRRKQDLNLCRTWVQA